MMMVVVLGDKMTKKTMMATVMMTMMMALMIMKMVVMHGDNGFGGVRRS